MDEITVMLPVITEHRGRSQPRLHSLQMSAPGPQTALPTGAQLADALPLHRSHTEAWRSALSIPPHGCRLDPVHLAGNTPTLKGLGQGSESCLPGKVKWPFANSGLPLPSLSWPCARAAPSVDLAALATSPCTRRPRLSPPHPRTRLASGPRGLCYVTGAARCALGNSDIMSTACEVSKLPEAYLAGTGQRSPTGPC